MRETKNESEITDFVNSALKYKGGKVNGIRASLTNITEDMRLQDQKMEAITTLAGGIAHQLNNALVGIIGNIELLKRDLHDDKKVDKYVEPMEGCAYRMTHLIDQLVSYARGGKYQPKTMSLNGFVEDTLPLIQNNIDPCIRVETDLVSDISNIEADPTQMQMVISALLVNAAEATEGPGRIRIMTRDEEIDEELVKDQPGIMQGRFVCLIVEDDGKGMDEETKSRVFEPFFTTKFQGRGLGMAAVYGIVKNHDGWASVDSELGKGTIVRIYLPASDAQIEEAENPKADLTKGIGTMLVIGDEEIAKGVNRAML